MQKTMMSNTNIIYYGSFIVILLVIQTVWHYMMNPYESEQIKRETNEKLEEEINKDQKLLRDIIFKVKIYTAVKPLHTVIKQFTSHLINIQKCDTVLADLNNIDELKNVVCIEYNSEGRCTFGGGSDYAKIDRLYNKYFEEKEQTAIFIQTKLYDLGKLKKYYFEFKKKSKEFMHQFMSSKTPDEKLFRFGMRVLNHLQQSQLEHDI